MDFINDSQSGIIEKIGNEIIHPDASIESLFEKVLLILSSNYPVEFGSIVLKNGIIHDAGVEVVCGSGICLKESMKPLEALMMSVIESGSPEINSHFTKLREEEDSGRMISSICVPLKKGDTVAGGILLVKHAGNESDLSEMLHLLKTVAVIISHELVRRHDLLSAEKQFAIEKEILKQKYSGDFTSGRLIGNSREMREIQQRIILASQNDMPVIITGESGTGKELIAELIHASSGRTGRFISVHLADMPSAMIDYELFGLDRKGFPASGRGRTSLMEEADGGTVFLDEISILPLTAQAYLLRIIHDRTIIIPATHSVKKIDVKIITATVHDMETGIHKNQFNEDLYNRLKLFSIHSPRLKERKSDIMLLVDYFLEHYAAKNGKMIRRLSPEAVNLLSVYHWPGNVRELENCIERAVLICDDDVIRSYHLPPSLQVGNEKPDGISLEERIGFFEKEIIIDSLKQSMGNISDAARSLKTTKRILGYKINRLGIDYKQFRRN